MRPNPLHDAWVFLTKASWLTPVFWLLLLAAAAIALAAWRRNPGSRTPRDAALALLRFLVGVMWWQQSLWKVPPNYGGLIYWMKQMVAHAAIPAQGDFVGNVLIPNIAIVGPLVYAGEVAVAVSLMLGLLSRLGGLVGLLMALNLWLGEYSTPGEWPWTYFFLVLLQAWFVIDPPGRCLGADVLLGSRVGRALRRPLALLA